nr:Hypothetical protein [Oryza sativa Japonica Group]
MIEGRVKPSRRSLQGGEQRQRSLPTSAQKLDWFFTRKGESPQGNISKEETAPTGVDVTDPGRPGRAFTQDSLEKCRISKKLEQECHRAHEAPARPKSPDYGQTGPPTRTNKSLQPPKDSTARSESRRPREGRIIKEGRRPGQLERGLRAESKGIKDIGVFHVSVEGIPASWGNLYNCGNHLQLHHQRRERSAGASSRATERKEEMGGLPLLLVLRDDRGRKTEEGRKERRGWLPATGAVGVTDVTPVRAR